MSYRELVRAWVGEDHDLIDQIAGACLSCSVDVLAEDTATENHGKRVKWANRVQKNPRVEAHKFLDDVCRNATIAASLPDAVDSDVKFVVASCIDTKATEG